MITFEDCLCGGKIRVESKIVVDKFKIHDILWREHRAPIRVTHKSCASCDYVGRIIQCVSSEEILATL